VPESVLWHAALARVRAAANAQGVLIAGAETQSGVDGFRPFIEGRLLDVIMPDVKYAGGIAPTLAIAQLAHEHGVQVAPHNPTGPVCTYASLHAAACAPEVPLLELQVGESALYFDLVRGTRPAFDDGCFAVPDTPGLGVELDDSLVRAHPMRDVPYGPEEQLG
jgi:galactonate dehydratase